MGVPGTVTGKKSDAVRDELRTAIINRLLDDGLANAEDAASPTAVADATGTSRSTVYRYLPSPADALVDTATWMFTTSAAQIDTTLAMIMTLWRDQIAALHPEDIEGRSALLRRMLALNHQMQFSNRAMPVGWILHAAVITRSEAWQGEPPPGDRGRQHAANAIINARRDFYEAMAHQLEALLTMAVRAMGRQFKPGVAVYDVVSLMNAFSDGLVLRAVLDPDEFSPDVAADALYRLAESFTEPAGFAADPARPTDPKQAAQFDAVVAAAIAVWADKGRASWARLAEVSCVKQDAAKFMFSNSLGRVADSAARYLLHTEAFGVAIGHQYPLDIVRVGLDDFVRVVDANPKLFHAVVPLDAAQPGDVLADAVEVIASVLASGVDSGRVVTGMTPDALAVSLVRFAVNGSDGHPAMLALLESAGPRT